MNIIIIFTVIQLLLTVHYGYLIKFNNPSIHQPRFWVRNADREIAIVHWLRWEIASGRTQMSDTKLE